MPTPAPPATALLTVEPAIPYLGPQPGNTYLDALLQLAQRHRQWLRALEDWKPESHNTRRQFGSLVRHLLAYYDVPAFMDAAWFEGENATARQHQDWFLYIANGQNIRTTMDLPVALTKKAAHHFLKAPRDFSIVGALRWGQVHGMGGDEYLARAVAGSRLAEILPDEPFWATVLQFFVNSPMLDRAQIGPMVDYLYHQKFVPQDVLDPNGQVERTGAPEPDLVMKGRTAAALQRRVEEWHRQLARETKRPPREWMRSGIGEFRLLQRDASTRETTLCWTIQELLSSKELQEEGRAMHNCVATYADSCAQGGCSIWALRLSVAHEATRRHIMTIEVDNKARAIVQARGPCNTTPNDRRASSRLQTGVEMLRRWAEQEKLTLARYVW
jgi:hypothetical protein